MLCFFKELRLVIKEPKVTIIAIVVLLLVGRALMLTITSFPSSERSESISKGTIFRRYWFSEFVSLITFTIFSRGSITFFNFSVLGEKVSAGFLLRVCLNFYFYFIKVYFYFLNLFDFSIVSLISWILICYIWINHHLDNLKRIWVRKNHAI